MPNSSDARDLACACRSSFRHARQSTATLNCTFTMAKLRLRHPKGVSTIDIDLDNATVQDLQHRIFGQSEIMPSQQDRTFASNCLFLRRLSPQKGLCQYSEVRISTKAADNNSRTSGREPRSRTRRSANRYPKIWSIPTCCA